MNGVAEQMIDVALLGAAIGCSTPTATEEVLHRGAGFERRGSWGDEALISLASDAVVALGPATGQPKIDALLGRVDDAAVAAERLMAAGIATRIVERGDNREVLLTDADGLAIRLVELSDPSADPAARGSNGLRLHHVSITTLDLPRSVAFYERHLGLRTVAAFPSKGAPSLVLMGDSVFDPATQTFVLEIIGPPHQPREVAAIARLGGPCFDHFCATTDDVATAHGACLAAGCRTSEAPDYVEEMGISLSYLYLPDDVELELMDALQPGVFS